LTGNFLPFPSLRQSTASGDWEVGEEDLFQLAQQEPSPRTVTVRSGAETVCHLRQSNFGERLASKKLIPFNERSARHEKSLSSPHSLLHGCSV
jgi:hypothetical protein